MLFRSLGHADAAGLRQIEIGAVQKSSHILDIRKNPHARISAAFRLQAAVKLFVRAADNGQQLVLPQLAGEPDRQPVHRSAAHAAAHHHHVATVTGQTRTLFRRFGRRVPVERPADRNAARIHAVGRNLPNRKEMLQRAVRNKVAVQVGFRKTGGAGVVGRNEAGLRFFHPIRECPERVADHHRRENVRADHRVKPALAQVDPQLFRPAPEQPPEQRALPEGCRMRLAKAVDLVEEGGRVPVDPDVTARKNGGQPAKNKAQRIARDAFVPALGHLVGDCPRAGIVPAANAAAQNQDSHFCVSSTFSPEATGAACSRAATHFASLISRGRL